VGTTCLALVWLLPYSGTWFKGEYVLSTAASAIKQALVFLVAAVSYRVAIASGWPQATKPRIAVVLLNTGLVVIVLAWSEVVDAALAGLVDRQYGAMRAEFHTVFAFLGRLDWFVGLLRSYFIPYALGLCGIALTLVTHRRHREALQAAELARAFAVTRLALLTAQLQPHFLFNSLNTITELMHEDPARASKMVVRLGSFLRRALETESRPWVDLATELEGVEAYLDVQRIRFESDLIVAITTSPESLGIYVPSLILQPLVENSITHGRHHSAEPLRVSIETSLVDGRVHIAISNSRPRLPSVLAPSQYRRGLANVAKRLEAAYGQSATLHVGPGPTDGTLAQVDLPALRTPPFDEVMYET
jgi:Histidine kinase